MNLSHRSNIEYFVTMPDIAQLARLASVAASALAPLASATAKVFRVSGQCIRSGGRPCWKQGDVHPTALQLMLTTVAISNNSLVAMIGQCHSGALRQQARKHA